MPDFDFDAFNHDDCDEEGGEYHGERSQTSAAAEVASEPAAAQEPSTPSDDAAPSASEEVDKW